MDPAKGSALGSRQGLCPCTPRRVFDPLDTLFAIMVSGYFAVRTREGGAFGEVSGRALMARALRLVVVEFRGPSQGSVPS